MNQGTAGFTFFGGGEIDFLCVLRINQKGQVGGNEFGGE